MLRGEKVPSYRTCIRSNAPQSQVRMTAICELFFVAKTVDIPNIFQFLRSQQYSNSLDLHLARFPNAVSADVAAVSFTRLSCEYWVESDSNSFYRLRALLLCGDNMAARRAQAFVYVSSQFHRAEADMHSHPPRCARLCSEGKSDEGGRVQNVNHHYQVRTADSRGIISASKLLGDHMPSHSVAGPGEIIVSSWRGPRNAPQFLDAAVDQPPAMHGAMDPDTEGSHNLMDPLSSTIIFADGPTAPSGWCVDRLVVLKPLQSFRVPCKAPEHWCAIPCSCKQSLQSGRKASEHRAFRVSCSLL